MIRCEVCGKRATHCCAGLDVPALHFCAKDAKLHQAACLDVRLGEAAVVKMGPKKVDRVSAS